MRIAAIDYSMTSPAICVANTEKPLSFENCFFYNISNIKNKPYRENIHYTEMKYITDDEERFDYLSNWAVEALQVNNVEKVIMEGYSFGSKSSRLFQIGENGGVLKHKIFRMNIPLIKLAPTEVKKVFHGKGNASKEDMIEALFTKEGIRLGDNAKSPIGDIVDSYAILYSAVTRGLI